MKSEKYKGVHFDNSTDVRFKNFKKKWKAALTVRGIVWQCYYLTEREAALGYDLRLIRFKKEPVNILKRKIAY